LGYKLISIFIQTQSCKSLESLSGASRVLVIASIGELKVTKLLAFGL